MSAEGEGKPSAEMAALIAQAGNVDAETAPQVQSVGMGAPGEPGGAMIAQDPRAEMKGQIGVLLQILVGVAGELFPKLPKVWTPEVIENVADKAAAVAIKRGWSAGFLGKWEAEVMLGVALVPLLKPTMDAMQEEEKREEKPVEGQRVEDPKPAAPAAAPSTGQPAPATEDDVLSRPVTVTVGKT